jgi:hypothetical protein
VRNLLGISCEKSRFYPKKIIFFPILGGARSGCAPTPLDLPLVDIGVVSVMQHSLIMLITASAFTLAEFGACVW